MQTTSGRPKDLEKRARILQAAKSIFLKMGYHATNMDQIAKEAAVTKLTVYNHFQDKANLSVRSPFGQSSLNSHLSPTLGRHCI